MKVRTLGNTAIGVLLLAVLMFPLYWMVVTSFKLPIQVDSGPFYIPFVDFQPSLHAWQYILVGDLSSDTRRQYFNTVVVALTSTALVMVADATRSVPFPDRDWWRSSGGRCRDGG